MRNLNDILKLIYFIHITEKAIKKINAHQYTFIIDKSLTKLEIIYFFQTFFNLTIKKLNTLSQKLKSHKLKKIYITFSSDIDIIFNINLSFKKYLKYYEY